MSRFLGISLRTCLLPCYVFSGLLYGVEARALTDAMCRRLAAFEMRAYRRVLEIPWTARITHLEALRRMKKQIEIMDTIYKDTETRILRHVMRNDKYGLLHNIIQRKVEGRRGPDHRRTSWLKNWRQWQGESTTSLFRKVVDKVQVMRLVMRRTGESKKKKNESQNNIDTGKQPNRARTIT